MCVLKCGKEDSSSDDGQNAAAREARRRTVGRRVRRRRAGALVKDGVARSLRALGGGGARGGKTRGGGGGGGGGAGGRGAGGRGGAVLAVEDVEDALFHELVVGVVTRRARGRQGHDVRRVKAAGAPADKADKDVGVFAQILVLCAKLDHARRIHGGARLGDHGGAVVVAQPLGNRLEALDVVGGALLVLARVVDVEVLVQIEQQAVGSAVGVGDLAEQVGALVGHKVGGAGKVVAGEEDDLRLGAGLADGGDGGLAGVGPFRRVEVVRLIHQTKDDLFVVGVLFGNVGPELGKRVVRGSALADDALVVAGKVVQVNHAVGARVEARLHEGVVALPALGVEGAAALVVGEELPGDGQAEDVELVVLYKVLHLGLAVGAAIVLEGQCHRLERTGAVNVAAKVDAGHGDAEVLQLGGSAGGEGQQRGGAGK